ncbi:MAG TPA: carbohydrate ABC transporter permease [Longilinea sp.]|nr:carbohydrate ABC transporter permease [Longilinea sp.]
MKKNQPKWLGTLLTYALMLLGAAIFAGPFLWMLSTSLKFPADQYTRTFIADPATLENYANLLRRLPELPIQMWNSFYLAALTTIGQVITCSMAAFAFAAVNFKGRNFLFTLLLITFVIPPQVTLIPNFIIFNWLGWVGTQLPLWVPAFWGGAFGTFLIRQYFLTIPRELAEAARMDGASLIRIFWDIYLPLAKPALAALALFTFLGSWNDLLHPLIYMPSDMQKTTITVGLSLFQTQYGGQWTIMMAGTVVSVLPIIILFFFTQKQFIQGIALSGVKR